MSKTSSNKTRRRPSVSKKSAGRTRAGTSRPVYAAKDRIGHYMLPSTKAGGLMVTCESALETLTAIAMEMDTRVQEYRSQPCAMDVASGSIAANREELANQLGKLGMEKAVLWFPDFEMKEGALRKKWLIEVKPKELAETIAADKIAQRSVACRRHGINFAVVTEEEFRSPLGTNLRVLWRYREMKPSAELRRNVHDLLIRSDGDKTIKEVVETGVSGLAEIYTLISTGHLWADLSKEKLSPSMRIKANLKPTFKVLSFLNKESV